jgi:hypothetical protein
MQYMKNKAKAAVACFAGVPFAPTDLSVGFLEAFL